MCLLERDLRPPAGRRPELRRVAADDGDLARPEAGWVLLDLDRAARVRDEQVEDLSHLDRLTRGDVVCGGLDRGVEQRLVGPRDVADVRDVAPRAEVADEDRSAAGLLGACDLGGPGADGEALVPPRAFVLERAGDDDVRAAAPELVDS